MSHPNILKLISIGKWEDQKSGNVFYSLITELAELGSLNDGNFKY